MNKKELIYIGSGFGIIVLIGYLVNRFGSPLIKEAIENVDSGMDKIADYYVKKEMAWNAATRDGASLGERYRAYMEYLRF